MDELEQGLNGSGPKSNIIGEIKKPAKTESFAELCEFCANIERQNEFLEPRIEEVRRALELAFQNVIDYSFKGKDGEISVTCKYDPWGKFMIVISDDGEPSNLLLADVIFAGEDDPVDKKRKVSAKTIKKLIDNVEYKRVDNSNVLTFTIGTDLRGK
jgi:anti-sigma regulatory factor (Ser/Thr protein kinase)